MNLAIDMSEEDRRRLAEFAERLDISVESLAEAAIRDLVSRPSDDFRTVAKRLLTKNRELYDRLS